MVTHTWFVIIPPLLVLLCVLLTRRMILSFLVGIVSSALIAQNGALWPSLQLIAKRFEESSGLNKIYSWQELWTNWNLSIFIFLLSLGILITLLQRSGSTQAFVRLAQKMVKGRTSAETTSLLLSLVFFIDDYFSALTVGSVMRPLATLYHVHPVKLAFLVTAMASPLTILSPLSSWVGEIIVQLKQVGVGIEPGALVLADPYAVFLRSIPFIFYAFLMIFSVWYIVLRGISYGPMAVYDKSASEIVPHQGKIQESNVSIFDFAFPLLVLIGLTFITLLVTGYNAGASSLIEALKNGSIQQAFLVSGLGSVSISCLFFLAKRKLSVHALGSTVRQGAWLMVPSIIMLVHAWTLSILLKQDLQTGAYIASLFSCIVCISMFPVACFITSALISWMIGSAWATMGLMFPIILPMAKVLLELPQGVSIENAPVMLFALGASLSGCVIGAHLSFIADNPIMAAASSGASHFELIKAMMWYVIPVGIATALAYYMLGLCLGSCSLLGAFVFALCVGIITVIALFEIAQRLFGKVSL